MGVHRRSIAESSVALDQLKAPFPWFGGKSRAAEIIWGYFGDCPNYVEPFAGSLAVLLARPHAPRIETVNDLDCYLANFWRAVAANPELVAHFANWPVNEADLHARHRWLVDWTEFRTRVRAEPDYFDAKVAGWWVWGLCAWIGTGWCRTDREPSEQAPPLGGSGNDHGTGIHAKGMRVLTQQIPFLGGFAGGGNNPGTQGQGTHAPDTRSRIAEVFAALSDRLRYTRVACGDFERVLSDSVTWRHGTTAILLDPPYADGDDVYTECDHSTFVRVATWAAEHGEDKRLRICLCGYDGTWAPPAGWTTVPWKARGGYGGQRLDGENVNAKRERLWFSPGCIVPNAVKRQGTLFDL